MLGRIRPKQPKGAMITGTVALGKPPKSACRWWFTRPPEFLQMPNSVTPDAEASPAALLNRRRATGALPRAALRR